MVYTVTLNPALDYVLSVEELKEGVNRADGAKLFYGGKGINVSAVLKTLGIENKTLGFIAGLTGEKLNNMLKADGIDADFIRLTNGETRINVKIRTDKELDINAPGASFDNEDIIKLCAKVKGLKEGDYLVLSGSVPEGADKTVYAEIAAAADKGVKLIVDAEGELFLNTLKHKPFLVKPNHIELSGYFGVEIKSEEEIVEYSKKLQELGAKNVLVSRAENGALLLDENGAVHKVGNAEGKLINSTGCGDSMLAGFIAGYIESGDYSHSLRLGAACGNATAYSQALAQKSEIEKYFNELAVD